MLWKPASFLHGPGGHVLGHILPQGSAAFTVPVQTANGRALAAPAILETVAVGPIVERRVPALVVRPGLLRTNLLGMSFLDRLGSYEVRGGRLILRGAGSVARPRNPASAAAPRSSWP